MVTRLQIMQAMALEPLKPIYGFTLVYSYHNLRARLRLGKYRAQNKYVNYRESLSARQGLSLLIDPENRGTPRGTPSASPTDPGRGVWRHRGHRRGALRPLTDTFPGRRPCCVLLL